MEFLENKYTRWYFHIIGNIKGENRRRVKRNNPDWVYYEQHHIMPKCFDGMDTAENLVLLTGREHFVAHWLLTKMVGDNSDKGKMFFALGRMMHSHKSDKKNVISGRRYEICRRAFSKNNVINTDRNEKISRSKLGIPRSEETKQKLRKYFTDNPSRPMAGKTHTDKTKAKMKANHKGMTGRKNPSPLKQCYRCGGIADARNIGRWHNKNCKNVVLTLNIRKDLFNVNIYELNDL